MKENSLKVTINCPVEKIFQFTIDPNNTPKWIDSIVREETDRKPCIGSIYRNINKNGIWNEYIMIDFELNQHFTLKQVNSDYSVRYTFKPIDENITEFTYFEWIEKGELEEPFMLGTLTKLKKILES